MPKKKEQHGISRSNETIRCFTTLHNLKLYLGFIAPTLLESLQKHQIFRISFGFEVRYAEKHQAECLLELSQVLFSLSCFNVVGFATLELILNQTIFPLTIIERQMTKSISQKSPFGHLASIIPPNSAHSNPSIPPKKH